MSAIHLVNDVSVSTAPTAEFRVYQGLNQIARLGVHAGSSASVPLVIDENNDGHVSTAEVWTAYAIVNGITTQNVTITDPNATVTLRQDNNEGFSLSLS
jgi:hypothetical protein